MYPATQPCAAPYHGGPYDPVRSGAVPRVDGSASFQQGTPTTVPARIRRTVDAFASAFPETLPGPDSDGVPRAGRHVRCAGDNGAQVYAAGKTHERSARGRVAARSVPLPSGWFLRFVLLDCAMVTLSGARAFSRADPEVLRVQRRMADPAFLNGLAAPLRTAFPGRPVHVDRNSLFVSRGLAFVREASISLPLPEAAGEDDRLCAALIAIASAFLTGGESTGAAPSDPMPEREVRRGHLRLVQ